MWISNLKFRKLSFQVCKWKRNKLGTDTEFELTEVLIYLSQFRKNDGAKLTVPYFLNHCWKKVNKHETVTVQYWWESSQIKFKKWTLFQAPRKFRQIQQVIIVLYNSTDCLPGQCQFGPDFSRSSRSQDWTCQFARFLSKNDKFEVIFRRSVLTAEAGCYVLKPLQNKKDQKIWGTRKKKQSFYLEKDCVFFGYTKYFWPFLFWSGFRI